MRPIASRERASSVFSSEIAHDCVFREMCSTMSTLCFNCSSLLFTILLLLPDSSFFTLVIIYFTHIHYPTPQPVPPDPGAVPSCAEGGVLGVLPGVFGCLQATEALKILLVKGKVDGYLEKEQGLLVGRILVYDALKMLFTEAGVQKLNDREEILELIDYQGFCAGPSSSSKPATSKEPKKEGRTMDEAESDDSQENAEPEFHSLTPTEALDKLRNGWSPWVMDVRLQTEHDIVALPFTDIVSPHRTVQVHEIPVDGDVLVYCKAGVRGKKACKRLIDLGVDADRLYNLDGGIMRWRTDVDSSMPKY